MTSLHTMKSGDILGGKYRLTQEIGKGAMGAVWAAEDHESNRSVAVKFILPPRKDSSRQDDQAANDLRQRLLREARACGKLCHRHIVQIFDVAEAADGEPFLVLELLHGQTVAQLLDEKRRIEPAMAARIVAEAASGLAAAHSAQVIHRDIKPANLYLHREEGMSEGEFILKVLDFGVCKTLDSAGSVVTRAHTAVGTPAYMSPEQAAMRKDLDHRTDIWSLGIVLYELLTGARPFSGTVEEVIRQILFTPVPPPSAKVRDVSPELDLVVAMCTATRCEKRYSSAEDLANVLFTIAETHRRAQRKTTGMVRMAASTALLRAPSVMPDVASSPEKIADSPSNVGILPHASSTMPVNSRAVEDDDDMAPTVPISKRMLSESMRTGRKKPILPGTQVLHAAQIPGSPEPPWKQEMKEALAARRHSSSDMDVLHFDESAAGSTQVVEPEVRLSELRQSIAGKAPSYAEQTSSEMTMPLPPFVGPPVQRRRGSTVLLGTLGVIVVAAVVVGVMLEIYQEKPRDSDDTGVPRPIASAMTSPVALENEKPSGNAELPPKGEKPGEKTESLAPMASGPAPTVTNKKPGSAGGTNSLRLATPRPKPTSKPEKKPCTPTIFTRCPK